MQSTKLELIKIIENIQNEDLLLRLKAFLREWDYESKPERKVSSLSKEEARLLQRINQGLPEASLARYQELLTRLALETLSKEEHAELVKLTQSLEAKNVQRMRDLAKLAKLWNASLQEVIDRLGITPPSVLHV